MVFILLALLFASGLAFRALSKLNALRGHTKQASESGWPHFLSPIHVNDTTYLFTHKFVASITKWLPQDQMRRFFPWTILLRIWHAGYDPFKDIGSDTFLLSSATGNMLLTCDPTVYQQIFSQANNFKAPVETLYIYNIYGPTMAACEDEDWRRFRKITTPYFNRETNNAVWVESIRQTEVLLKSWDNNYGFVTHDIKQAVTAKLTLSVIAKVFFDRDVHLKDYEMDNEVNSSHEMSFGKALLSVIRYLPVIIMTPSWLANHPPFEIIRTGNRAYMQWKQYMEEMHDEALTRLNKTTQVERKYNTFLESLVAAGSTEIATNAEKLPQLSQEEVFGNIFLFLMAGHDTSSTTAAFGILLLALHPECQQKLQQQLADVLGKRPSTDWTLERDFQPLFEGYLGAVIKETLRLYCPVEFLPKRARENTMITDGTGKVCCVPKGTICMLDFAATSRHPKYWPFESTGNAKQPKSPALQFNPDSWLNQDIQSLHSRTSAYFPFGGGQRSCPGKRFAEIQLCVIFARIFHEYSVELVPVEEDQKEATLKGLSAQWLEEKTKERAATLLYEGIGFTHAIYPSNHLPIRFVERSTLSHKA